MISVTRKEKKGEEEEEEKKAYMASLVSHCIHKIPNGTEWIRLLQKKVVSFLFLLLVLSTVFLFSVCYFSRNVSLGKSDLHTDHLQENSIPQVTHDEDENYSVESSPETSDRNPLFAS
jgi:hypothetical protein